MKNVSIITVAALAVALLVGCFDSGSEKPISSGEGIIALKVDGMS
ncbi:MAG: hypothetical protein P1U89_17105 [Verrucomicrobiales bacterium]|nr:hypothetical protein [Verrucomicrobiales bacterium]